MTQEETLYYNNLKNNPSINQNIFDKLFIFINGITIPKPNVVLQLINGIPMVTNAFTNVDVFSQLFSQGNVGTSFQNANYEGFLGTETNQSFDDKSNEKALTTIFQKDSLFYTPQYVTENIDFVKLVAIIANQKDIIFNYEHYIGKKTDIYYIPLVSVVGIPIIDEDVETEIPLKKQDFAQNRVLDLKARLNTLVDEVNIYKNNESDTTAGLEFEFNYKTKKVSYKFHHYYVGKNRVFENNNSENNIAFTISTPIYQDFLDFREIAKRVYVDDYFEKQIETAFLNAIEILTLEGDYTTLPSGQSTLNTNKLELLDWLYENIPSFVAKKLNFEQTISNVFKLSRWDAQSPITDSTKSITTVLSRLGSKKVYSYFLSNPESLILFLNRFSDDATVEQFCNYLTALTLLYLQPDTEKARKFSISDDTHIETNILSGDDKGKVELTNELQLPTVTFRGLNLINLFAKDIEINNTKNQTNQFHPLQLIYITHYDEDLKEEIAVPTIALYGKYLGDKTEWNDVVQASIAVIDVIGIIFSGGALNAGVKGAAKLFAIIDISVSTINLALFSDPLKAQLNKTEAGRWFVSYWPIISLCLSAGTISYYLAKGIIKYAPQFRNQIQNDKALIQNIDELEDISKKVVDDVDLMSKPPKTNEITGGKLMSESRIRKYKGELRQKGIEPIFEDDLLLNKAGKKIQNKATFKKFVPFTENGIHFENPSDFYFYMRKKGNGGGFHAKSKQLFLTENPTEYLAFHERAHVKHFLEIGDEYHTQATWKKETYVFNEIWTNKHLWTEKELKHALDYVNGIRKKAKQLEITKKM